ncbi:MAG: GNAT family N-acetyltransferase [Oscillospiraceae bacterium]
MNTPQLKTQRLTLRQVSLDDVSEIFNCWMNDEDVSKYMYWKSSNDIKEIENFVQYELSMINSDSWYRWIIVSNRTNKIIGTCLIYFNEDENSWDISYNLGKIYWGNGFTTEAMIKVLDFAKKELHIKEVIAIHSIQNLKSARVIEKLGFQYVKDVPFECNGGTIHTKGKYYKLFL